MVSFSLISFSSYLGWVVEGGLRVFSVSYVRGWFSPTLPSCCLLFWSPPSALTVACPCLQDASVVSLFVHNTLLTLTSREESQKYIPSAPLNSAPPASASLLRDNSSNCQVSAVPCSYGPALGNSREIPTLSLCESFSLSSPVCQTDRRHDSASLLCHDSALPQVLPGT